MKDENMKAKELITGQRLGEAETPGDEAEASRAPQPPPGSTSDRPRPMRPRGPGMPPGGMGRGPMMRPPGPPPLEEGIKNVMLLFLTEGVGNDYDGRIVRKLIDGHPLEQGELQHVLDEGARLQNLPEPLVKVLEAIHQRLQAPPA